MFNLLSEDEEVTLAVDGGEEDIAIQDPENDEMVTASIIQDEMDDEEIEELVESYITQRQLQDEGILSERTIIKLDKKSRKKQAESTAVLAVAREKNDKDFKKLVTVYKLRKMLLAKLNKKYATQARNRVKSNAKKMTKSKVKSVAKAGSKKK